MIKDTIQTFHLICIYLLLITLGVLLEFDIPNDAQEMLNGEYQGNSLSKKQLKYTVPSHDQMDDLKRMHTIAHSSNVTVGKVVQLHSNVIPNEEAIETARVTYEFKYYVEKGNQKYNKPLKPSVELDAYDEIVSLLTTSAIYCTKEESYRKTFLQSLESYHCSPRGYNVCGRSDKKKKYKCHNSKKLVGYDVRPAKSKKYVGHITDMLNMSKQKLESFKDKTSLFHEIKVNAELSFIEDFKKIRYRPVLRLDFVLYLEGLNSIHRYEVIMKLLRIMRLVLIGPGYLLERSSADNLQLQAYLHEEGLSHPLHILTLWRQYL